MRLFGRRFEDGALIRANPDAEDRSGGSVGFHVYDNSIQMQNLQALSRLMRAQTMC